MVLDSSKCVALAVVMMVVLLLSFYLYVCSCRQSISENFTVTETTLGESLLEFFKQPAPTYDDYLNVLTSGNNQSDALVLPATFTKLKNTSNLDLSGVMNAFN